MGTTSERYGDDGPPEEAQVERQHDDGDGGYPGGAPEATEHDGDDGPLLEPLEAGEHDDGDGPLEGPPEREHDNDDGPRDGAPVPKLLHDDDGFAEEAQDGASEHSHESLAFVLQVVAHCRLGTPLVA